MRSSTLTATLLLGLLSATLLAPQSALAYIERMYSLGEVLRESTHVLVGKVERIDLRRRIAVARIDRSLKGGGEYRSIQMNIGLGPRDQGDYLLRRLVEGGPFILYYKREGGSIAAVAHSGDTWFQLYANHDRNRDRVWWRFTHIEVYMGRTFNGNTPELVKLTDDVVARRRKAPPPDPRVPRLDLHKPRPRTQVGAVGQVSPEIERVVIAKRSAWKYLRGTREASTDRPHHAAWRTLGFDDSTWPTAKAPFGYGDPPFGTTLADMRQRDGNAGYATVYLRQKFDIEDPAAVRAIDFDIDYDDGFVLWLNGKEAIAENRPGRLAHDQFASAQHESGSYEPFRVGDPKRFLVRGTNVIAVQVFNISLTSSDLKLDLEQRVRVATRPPGGSGRFRRVVELARGGSEARGISWVDIDGDERLDIYFCRGSESLLLMNEGERFGDGTARLGLPKASRSASWADYDGDDHADLLTNDFEIRRHAGGRLRLERGLLRRPSTTNTEGAGWIDYNGDGLPDVLITNGEHGIALFENTGTASGRFRDVSARAGLGARVRGNGDFVTFADYDGDGFTDFLYNLGKGVLAHNEGDGTFALDRTAGIELPGGADYKRGTSFADFDNDGDLDLFVPGPAGARLYQNQNDGTFQDVFAGSGDLARQRGPIFSGAWGDIDLDGDLDLFACHTTSPSRLYLGDGKGKFRDVTSAYGLDGLSEAHGASFADYDDDGDLDLAVNLGRKVIVARNELARAKGRTHLRVRVRARKGTIGCVVRVLDRGGRLLGLRELSGAESCGGQAAPLAHFGVPVGACTVTVALSDGRVGQKKVTVAAAGLTVDLRESEFEK